MSIHKKIKQLNPFVRYQKELKLIDLYPSLQGLCACGCGEKLSGKKTRWHSVNCSDHAYKQFTVSKGNNQAIRESVYERDNGFCKHCGVYDEKWQADHILPVHIGGGACSLSNYQTLCYDCHLEKTYKDCHHKLYSSQDASNLLIASLYDDGA